MEIQGTLKKVHPEILRGEFKCRKIWHSFTEEEQQARLKEMEEATS
jgi:hypothetical protein